MAATDDPREALIKLLQRDRRYHFEAYAFVFEALSYAHDKLGLGKDYIATDIDPVPLPEAEQVATPQKRGRKPRAGAGTKTERHLTGKELCEAIRIYALEQFGYMAKCVLNCWGIRSTADFGEIVFNLIEIQQMRKTKYDRREDFENVYDFDEAFVRGFKITE
jgi:uncharacterized repeat protein (TIGR04138 family)